MGLLIILFRLAIELPFHSSITANISDFEDLDRIWHFTLPIVGAFIIAVGMHFLKEKHRNVSVSFVLERLHNFQGRMPLANMLVQFFGGIVCLISGQSVGREGPAIHLGASAASLLGQWFKLPHNSLNTMIGCGVAAAISASFNTPVAGVIFAMEVILMSYTITSFIPIMLASVCGALVSQATLGEEVFFTFESGELNGLWEFPIMIAAGLIVALFATLYIRLQLTICHFSHLPIFFRIISAGVLTGTVALFFPQILGMGYDTMNNAANGDLALWLLFILIFAKIVTTSFGLAMGLPAGLIGPQLFIGACIGGIVSIVGNELMPVEINNSGIYVLLGMAAMMGAVLNAPLAALMAVVELTYNPAIMLPGMLIIVVSCVTTRQLLSYEGIFVELLKTSGKHLNFSPVQQVLSNIGVRSAMKTAIVLSPAKVSLPTASNLLATNPLWIVIDCEDNYLLLRAADLAIKLKSQNEKQSVVVEAMIEESYIDLLEIPAQRFNLIPVTELASLYEAKTLLDKNTGAALFVTPQIHTGGKQKVLGIITQDTISNYYI